MNEIKIHEVGLRDGLQIEKQTVPLEKKIAWIEGLLAAGIDMIQLGSFVNPEKVPQMADTDKLFAHFNQPGKKPAGVVLSGLVLNEKGLERGMACGVDMFCMGVSASDTHSRKNTGKGTDEAVGQIIAMAQAAMKAQKRVQASIQSAFGCGFEGPIPAERVLAIVDKYLAAGIRNISLADTAGHAYPPQVEALYAEILKRDGTGRAGLPFPQHLWPGPGQLLRGPEDRGEIFRVGPGRPGRLPLHQGGGRQRLHRGPGPFAAAPGAGRGDQPGQAAGDRPGRRPLFRPRAARLHPEGGIHRQFQESAIKES